MCEIISMFIVTILYEIISANSRYVKTSEFMNSDLVYELLEMVYLV